MPIKKCYPYLLTCFIVFISSCGLNKKSVEYIYFNAQIITMNDSLPSASVIAIDKGKILAIGGQEVLEQYKASEENTIDLKQQYVYPGLIDAHCHFYGYASNLLSCDLVGTKSWDEVLSRIKTFASTNNGEWITGRGWDQNDWAVKEFPDNTELNKLFPNQAVILKRIDGHAAICNNKALELAGILPEPAIKVNLIIDGGEIIRKDGIITGVLIDNAVERVEKVVSAPSKQNLIKALMQAEKDCYSNGLTTLADAGLDIKDCLFLDSLHDAGHLSIYLYMMLNPTTEGMEYAKRLGIYESDNGKICSFKLYADGALGSRGAKLKKPYCDRHDHSGAMIHPMAYYDSFARMTYAFTKYQLNTHCIGDSANSMLLNIFSKFLPEGNDLRWRIEHAQIVDRADMDKFSKYGIIPSVQPTHATSDGPWAEARLCKERLSGAYAYKSLLSQNQYIPLGTDFPVEHISPIYTFYSAVYRESATHPEDGTFLTAEALSAEQALKGMTVWAAKSCRLEHRKGQLKVGMDGDLTVLDKNLLKASKAEVKTTKVVRTVRSGKTVFGK
jgi:predicted amidohydrolase YtcJ